MGRWASTTYTKTAEAVVKGNESAPNYGAFPGVAETSPDHLIAVYMRATDESATRDGNIKKRTSSDGGATWSAEATVLDNANDLRDPALTILSDGTLVCSLFEWTNALGERAKVLLSSDDGATWGALVAVASSFTSWWACSAPVVELANGDLLLPVYGRDSGDTTTSARVSISTDGGATWAHHAEVVDGPTWGRHAQEPFIVADPAIGNKLYCFFRSDTATAGIYLTTSSDGGATWSTPTRLFNGSGRPAAILTAQRLMALDYRNTDNSSRHGLRYSADLGASWTSPDTVNSTALMAYGQWVVLADGTLGLVWSVEQPDGRADVLYQAMSPPGEAALPQLARVRGVRPPAVLGSGMRLARGGMGV